MAGSWWPEDSIAAVKKLTWSNTAEDSAAAVDELKRQLEETRATAQSTVQSAASSAASMLPSLPSLDEVAAGWGAPPTDTAAAPDQQSSGPQFSLPELPSLDSIGQAWGLKPPTPDPAAPTQQPGLVDATITQGDNGPALRPGETVGSVSVAGGPTDGAPIGGADRPARIASAAQYARAAEQKTGVPAEVSLAFAVHESGLEDRYGPGQSYHGRHAVAGEDGTPTMDWGYDANGNRVDYPTKLKSYSTPGGSFDDFADLIANSSRYRPAMERYQQTGDKAQMIRDIWALGYGESKTGPDETVDIMRGQVEPQMGAAPRTQPRQAAQGPMPEDTANGGRSTADGSWIVDQQALDDPAKWSLCGPVAAVMAANKRGAKWTVAQAKQIAQSVSLWDEDNGMHGLQSEVALLNKLDVPATTGAADQQKLAADAAAGNTPIISTNKHYFILNGYDEKTGKFDTVTSGPTLKGGSQWLTLDEIAQLGNGIQGAAYIDNPSSPTPSVVATGSNQGMWSPDSPSSGPSASQAPAGRSGGGGVQYRAPMSSTPQEVGNGGGAPGGEQPYDPRTADQGAHESLSVPADPTNGEAAPSQSSTFGGWSLPQDEEQPRPGTDTPIQNADGSVTTERSITVTEPGLNGGRATNIPTVWNGRVVSNADAVDNAIRSGVAFPSFDSIDAAVSAAEQRSADLGAGRERSIGGTSLPYDSRQADQGPHEAIPGSVGASNVQPFGPPLSEAGPETATALQDGREVPPSAGGDWRAMETRPPAAGVQAGDQPPEDDSWATYVTNAATNAGRFLFDPSRPGRTAQQMLQLAGIRYTPTRRTRVTQERGEVKSEIDPGLDSSTAIDNAAQRGVIGARVASLDGMGEAARILGMPAVAEYFEADSDRIKQYLYDNPDKLKRATQDVFDGPLGIVEGVVESAPSLLPTLLGAVMATAGAATGNPGMVGAGAGMARAGLAAGVLQSFGSSVRGFDDEVAAGTMSQATANIVAIGSGLAEYLTEKIFPGADQRLINGMGEKVAQHMAEQLGKRGLLHIGKEIGKETAQEGIEEAISEAYGVATDIAFSSEKPTLLEAVRRIGSAAAVGGASGAAMTGVNTAVETGIERAPDALAAARRAGSAAGRAVGEAAVGAAMGPRAIGDDTGGTPLPGMPSREFGNAAPLEHQAAKNILDTLFNEDDDQRLANEAAALASRINGPDVEGVISDLLSATTPMERGRARREVLSTLDHAVADLPQQDEGTHEYSSTQLDMPHEVASTVRNMGEGIPTEDLAGSGRETEPHVTVKYGLETSNVDEVAPIVEAHKPITVTLGKTSVFEASQTGQGYDVVKIEADSPELRALNAELAKLPNGDKHPEYQPHVTVAYVKPGAGKKYAGQTQLDGVSIKIDDLTFSTKDGDTHRIRLLGKSLAETTPIPASRETAPSSQEASSTLAKTPAEQTATYTTGKGKEVSVTVLSQEPGDSAQVRFANGKEMRVKTSALSNMAADEGAASDEQMAAARAARTQPDKTRQNPTQPDTSEPAGTTDPALDAARRFYEKIPTSDLQRRIAGREKMLDDPKLSDRVKGIYRRETAQMRLALQARGEPESATPATERATLPTEGATSAAGPAARAAGGDDGSQDRARTSGRPASAAQDAEADGRAGRVRADEGQGDAGVPADTGRAAGVRAGGSGSRGVQGDRARVEPPTTADTPAPALTQQSPPPSALTVGQDAVFDPSDDALAEKSAPRRFDNNLAALDLLVELERERRPATADEQRILARYSGFGDSGFNEAFPSDRSTKPGIWGERRERLKSALVAINHGDQKAADRSLAAIEASRVNAMYTTPEVIGAMWRGLERMGAATLSRPRVLEPSSGSGRFVGLMPARVAARAQKALVELDDMTGRLARALFPASFVQITGFQDAVLPENGFDIVISNVPFAKIGVLDRDWPRAMKFLQAPLHNYFFAKALTKTRPGGVVAFVTSRFTMDGKEAQAKAFRQWMADRSDFLTAVRLPTGAFPDTKVAVDVIFLQKRDPASGPGDATWVDTAEQEIELQREYADRYGQTVKYADKRPYSLNTYYVQNPTHVLGTHDMPQSGGLYGGNEYTVSMSDPNWLDRFHRIMDTLPRGALSDRNLEMADPQRDNLVSGLVDMLRRNFEGAGQRPGAFYLDDTGQLMRANLVGRSVQPGRAALKPNQEARIKGMMGVRDAAQRVLESQAAGESDAALQSAQRALNRVYDAFVGEHGPLNAPANANLMKGDPDSGLLLALESWDTAKGLPTSPTKPEIKAMKAPIFTRRVSAVGQRVEKAGSAPDAMSISLNETGKLNWERMAELTESTPEQLQADLLGRGLVFENPEGGYEAADAYLSGTVRAKLRKAETAASADPRFQRNVDALRAVTPEDLVPGQISVKLGAPWVPVSVVNGFADQVMGLEPRSNRNGPQALFEYLPETGKFVRQVGEKNIYQSPANRLEWSTERFTPLELLESAIYGKALVAYDSGPNDTRVRNDVQTQAAQDKVTAIQERFSQWIWEHQGRGETLARIYNDNFNGIRPRVYDGSHLTFPGKVPDRSPEHPDGITLRPHQKNVIWRIIQDGTALLAHEVGFGKSFEMAAAAMELRRLGLSNRNLIVLKNGTLEQFVREFRQLYPGAKILAEDETLTRARRGEFMARIATGDWDAVVIQQSKFTLLPVKEETQISYGEQRIADLEAAIMARKSADGADKNDVAQKALQKALDGEKLKVQKLQAALDKRQDNAIFFEDLGIDTLFVDEADQYRRLPFATGKDRIKGIPNSTSQRAPDLEMKARVIQERQGGRGVVFATGTPISNSIAETWVMMKYLMPQKLDAMGLGHFDAWADTFGETVTDSEPNAAGVYRDVTRFSEFKNAPELAQIWQTVADVMMAADAPEMVKRRPKMVGGAQPGERILVESPRSEALADLMATFQARLEALKGTKPEPGADNHLTVYTQARTAAVDVRMVNPSAPEEVDGKLQRAAENIHAVWQRERERGGTQLVFLDFGTPKPPKAPTETVEGEVTDDPLNVTETLSDNERAEAAAGYTRLKNRLIERGIPEKEIGLASATKNKKEFEALLDKVRRGTIRVLIGSTEKMGAGVNVQARLAALHHINPPWNPRDVEQREGRILRQGNAVYGPKLDTNDNVTDEGIGVRVFQYVTKGSFDEISWQTLERKARGIRQLMRRNITERTIEDAGDIIESFATAKAAASGRPEAVRLVRVKRDLEKIAGARKAYSQGQRDAQYKVRQLPTAIESAQAVLTGLQQDAATVKDNPTPAIKAGKAVHDERGPANAAVRTAMAKTLKGGSETTVGTYRGLQLVAAPTRYARGEEVNVALNGTETYTAGSDAPTNESTDWWTRIGNAIDRIPSRISQQQASLQELQATLAAYQARLGQPFPQEQRYQTLIQEERALETILSQPEGAVIDGEVLAALSVPEPVTAIGEAPAPVAGPDSLTTTVSEETAPVSAAEAEVATEIAVPSTTEPTNPPEEAAYTDPPSPAPYVSESPATGDISPEIPQNPALSPEIPPPAAPRTRKARIAQAVQEAASDPNADADAMIGRAIREAIAPETEVASPVSAPPAPPQEPPSPPTALAAPEPKEEPAAISGEVIAPGQISSDDARYSMLRVNAAALNIYPRVTPDIIAEEVGGDLEQGQRLFDRGVDDALWSEDGQVLVTLEDVVLENLNAYQPPEVLNVGPESLALPPPVAEPVGGAIAAPRRVRAGRPADAAAAPPPLAAIAPPVAPPSPPPAPAVEVGEPTPPVAATPPVVPPGGTPPTATDGGPPSPNGGPPLRQVHTVGAGYWLTSLPESRVEDLRALLDEWAEYSRSGGVRQTEIHRLATLMGQDADWLQDVVAEALETDTKQASIKGEALQEAFVKAAHDLDAAEERLRDLQAMRARLGDDAVSNEELDAADATLKAAQSSLDLYGRAERRDTEAHARALGMKRFTTAAGAGADLVDRLDKNLGELEALARRVGELKQSGTLTEDDLAAIRHLMEILGDNGELIGGQDTQIQRVLRAIQGAVGEQNLTDKPPTKQDGRVITEKSDRLAKDIAKQAEKLGEKKGGGRRRARAETPAEVDERMDLARRLVQLDRSIRARRRSDPPAVIEAMYAERQAAAARLEELIAEQVAAEVAEQGETLDPEQVDEKIRERAAKGMVSRIGNQFRGPRAPDPEQIVRAAQRLRDEVIDALRTDGLLPETPMTLQELSVELVRLNKEQARLRDAGDPDAALALEGDRQSLLANMNDLVREGVLRRMQTENPNATMLDAERELAKGPLAAIRQQIEAQMLYPQRDMERLRVRLDKEMRRALTRADISAIIGRLRDVHATGRRTFRADDIRGDLLEIEAAILGLGTAARERALTIREGLMRANLLRDKKEDMERFKQLRDAMAHIDTAKPETVGAFLTTLREPGWLNYWQEGIVINLLTSPMTWGLTGINAVGNLAMVGYRAAEVSVHGAAEHRAWRAGLAAGRGEAGRRAVEIMDRGYLAADIDRAMLTGDFAQTQPELMGNIPYIGAAYRKVLYKISTRPLNATDAMFGHTLYLAEVYREAQREADRLLKAHPKGYRVPSVFADETVYSAAPDGTGRFVAKRQTSLVTDGEELRGWILRNLHLPQFKHIKENAGHIEDYTLLRAPVKKGNVKTGEGMVDHALSTISSMRYADRDASVGRKAVAVASHTALTFFLTSYNASKWALSLSPLGIPVNLYRAGANLTQGNEYRAKELLFKAGVGMVLMGLAAALKEKDWITGDGPSDATEYAKWRRTHEPSSVWVGGAWRRIDGLVLGLPLIATANAIEDAQEAAAKAGRKPSVLDTEIYGAFAAGLGKGAATAILGQSSLRGLSDMGDVFKDSKSATRMLSNIGLRVMPAVSLLRWGAQMGDPYMRDPQSMRDFLAMTDPINAAHRAVGMSTGNRGRESVQARLNDWGEPVANPRQGVIASLDPFRSARSPGLDDPILRHLNTIGYSLPTAPPTVNSVPLTPSEQREFTLIAGPKLKESLANLISNPSFFMSDPESQRKQLDQSVGSIRKAAASDVLNAIPYDERQRRRQLRTQQPIPAPV